MYYKTHTTSDTLAHFKLQFNDLKQLIKDYKIIKTKEDRKSIKTSNIIAKYGSLENYNKVLSTKQKQTTLARYNSETYRNSNKAKQTKLTKYGDENYNNRKKFHATMQERYNIDNALQSQELQNKKSLTQLHKYGNANYKNDAKIKQTCLDRYGVENPFQAEIVKNKICDTVNEKYGGFALQSDELRKKIIQTNLEKYGIENPAKSELIKEKTKQTNLQKYGVEQVLKSPIIQQKVKQTMLEKYGAENPSQVPEIRKKQLSSAKQLRLEKRFEEFLIQNKFNYIKNYIINNDKFQHSFDFALFIDNKLDLLVDCDGIYYHGYISDIEAPTDDCRSLLVPENVKFLVIIEGHEEEGYKECLKLLNINYDTYIKEIFNWCKSIEFPYPNITEDESKRSYKSLQSLSIDYNKEFSMNCRVGNKPILEFHKSIWKAHVGDLPSPYEAWQNDEIILKTIKNRIIYKGNKLDPSKILGGLTVTRVAQRVSVFNSALAKYLIYKYLNEFTEVFDPFSGYSGRMLGVCSSDKHYIGQDINEITINESNKIKDLLNLNADLYIRNSIEETGNYECLFTCSPYSNKENWGQIIENKSCDEWIDICLNNYNCNKYLFVVDKTEKYKDYIVEELTNKSHFNKNSEYVILIKK